MIGFGKMKISTNYIKQLVLGEGVPLEQDDDGMYFVGDEMTFQDTGQSIEIEVKKNGLTCATLSQPTNRYGDKCCLHDIRLVLGVDIK